MNFQSTPYQVFPKPIPPPPEANQGAVCLEIDSKWIPYLLGCVSQLAVNRTWTSDQERATGEARNLLSLFAGAKACPLPEQQGIEMEDCMGCCIRWSDSGVLQVLSCGEWVDVPGPGAGATANGPSIPRNPPQPAAGDCESFIGKVIFFGRWLLPVPVSAGDVVTVTNAFGATTDYIVDYPAWRCADGTEFIAGGCLTGSEIFNGSDPAPAFHHANLIAFDGTNYYDCGPAADGMTATISILPGVTNANLVFLINAPGPAGAGDISFDVRICKAAASPISITYPIGSGPAGVQPGGTIVVTAAIGGGHSQVTMDFGSACVNVTVLSYSSWVPNTGGGLRFYDYYDCSGTLVNGPIETGTTVPTDWPASTDLSIVGIAGDASGVFSLVCRVDLA